MKAQNVPFRRVTQFDVSKAMTYNKMYKGKDFNPTTKLVLRILVDCWNPRNNCCFPSIKFIVDSADISERSAKSAIQELKQKGIIVSSREGGLTKYYFTNLFWEYSGIDKSKIIPPTPEQEEQIKSADSSKKGAKSAQKNAKIAPESSAKFAPPYIEQRNYEQKKNKSFQNFQKDEKLTQYIGVEETKRQTDERRNVKKGSPLDLPKDEAIEFYNNLSPELKKTSIFAKQIKLKYGL